MGNRCWIPLGELKRLYVGDGMTIQQLALYYHCSNGAISRRLESLRITRTVKEAVRLSMEQGKSVFGLKGDKNPAWKGGRHMRGDYWNVWAPDNPRNNGGYVYEHILVWEKTHNQALPRDWIIHHINGVKTDNRPENLVAMKRGKHDKLIPEMAKRIVELEEANAQLAKLIPI